MRLQKHHIFRQYQPNSSPRYWWAFCGRTFTGEPELTRYNLKKKGRQATKHGICLHCLKSVRDTTARRITWESEVLGQAMELVSLNRKRKKRKNGRQNRN